jgi:hypothetical protein
VDVFDRDRATIAEVAHENCPADCSYGGCNSQHQHGDHLSDDAAVEHRERDQVDVN